jgi:probable F420-dependent oxidoreductase
MRRPDTTGTKADAGTTSALADAGHDECDRRPRHVTQRSPVNRAAPYDPQMRYGLCLPNFTELASAQAIDEAADAADRLGFDSVWTTDHVLVDTSSAAAEYRVTFDAIETLAWVGARHTALHLGTSVIVVPQRNAVILAKELATLDALSSGRLIAGLGIGWSEAEFANLGAADRFHVRGAYLDETIALWRHLWSGSTEPFDGRFHPLRDFTFGPLPAQRSSVPIWLGGRAEAALRRTGRVADGYQATSTSPDAMKARLPIIGAAAHEAGRPMPTLAARVRLSFDEPAESSEARPYALRGTPDQIRAEIERWEDLGAEHLAIWFGGDSLESFLAAAERFARDVAELD